MIRLELEAPQVLIQDAAQGDEVGIEDVQPMVLKVYGFDEDVFNTAAPPVGVTAEEFVMGCMLKLLGSFEATTILLEEGKLRLEFVTET